MRSMARPDPESTARSLLARRFPQAAAAFLGGSVLRGEATAYSDLDLVVVFPKLPAAYRESLFHEDWPVEIFVHDPETLAYFFQADRNEGVPSLPAMVAEGVELPQSTPFSRRLKNDAQKLLRNGPPVWSQIEVDRARYAISDLCDDLRQPRNSAERMASACRLHPALAQFALRARGHWSATGKTIPRQLQQLDPELCREFSQAFETVFQAGDTGPLLELSQKLLEPHGGFHFAGPPQAAPCDWRLRPEPRLFTERMVLRMGDESDIPEILDYFQRNRIRLAALEPERPANFYTAEYWRGYLSTARREFSQEKALRLLLFLRRSGRLQGMINFTQMHRGPFQACYVGYSLDGEAEGQGLMQEALGRAIDYVFSELNYHRIMANYLPENARSARLLQRLGFIVEGRASNYLLIAGQWRDHVLTSLTR